MGNSVKVERAISAILAYSILSEYLFIKQTVKIKTQKYINF